ncbi:MAG: pantothenate kinase [Alkalinema sp. RU_4_3]|nr:pantothenate kinase [Alkalinema sp. RU_4_3]
MTQDWLILSIGNSRLHWAWFQNDRLQASWDTNHLDGTTIQWLVLSQFNFQKCKLLPQGVALPRWTTTPDLWIASVVPQQMLSWQQYLTVRPITLDQVPLLGKYKTLGIDRALSLWGALTHYSGPALVIDGGTALTLTAADSQKTLIGGAILPGLQTQFKALKQSTAALPQLDHTNHLPDRWATTTPDAIQSGILHSVLSGLEGFILDWIKREPNSSILFTGGDGEWLYQHLEERLSPRLPLGKNNIAVDRNLLFLGAKAILWPNYPSTAPN